MLSFKDIPFLANSEIVERASKWFTKPSYYFSDLNDKLICKWTVRFLLTMALAIVSNNNGYLLQTSFQCMRNPYLTDDEHAHASSFCLDHMYYDPDPYKPVPWNTEDRVERKIEYYRWIPFILVAISIPFIIVEEIWHYTQRSGMDSSTFLSESVKLKKISLCDPERQQTVETLAGKLKNSIFDYHYTAGFFRRLFNFNGSYLMIVYLVVKIFYLIAIFCAFFYLNSRIGSDYYFWGISYYTTTIAKWKESPVFPTTVLCHMPIRKLGDVMRHTIHCNLEMNKLNEQIFLAIWWWLFFLAIFTFANLLLYMARYLFSFTSTNFVLHLLNQEKYMEILNSSEHRGIVNDFASKMIKIDGILLLRFIESHAGTEIAKELMSCIFDDHLREILHMHNDEYITVTDVHGNFFQCHRNDLRIIDGTKYNRKRDQTNQKQMKNSNRSMAVRILTGV